MRDRNQDVPKAYSPFQMPSPNAASTVAAVPAMPMSSSNMPMHISIPRPRAFQNPPVLLTPSRTPFPTRLLTSLASRSTVFWIFFRDTEPPFML